MTDSQRQTFYKNLTEYFSLIQKEINGEEIENTEKIDTWSRNLYERYCYAVKGVETKYVLPEEHMNTLKQELKKQNLTIKEYEKSSGNRHKLAKILKEKQSNECTIEDLKKERTNIENQINDLTRKQTKKYIQLYRLTPEQINQIQIELEKCNEKKKKINQMIKEKEQNLAESKEEKTEKIPGENYNLKMQKLMKRVYDQEEIIQELSKENKNYRQNEISVRRQYEDTIEKRVGERKAELEKEFEEKLKKEQDALNSKHSVELQNLTREFEAYKYKSEQQIASQKRKIESENNITRGKQKEIIAELLCSKDNITLNEIITKLEKEKISTEGIKEALAELKGELPGIVNGMTNDGKQLSYSIKKDAQEQLDEYKKIIVSPSLTNIIDGEVQFLVRADLHLNLTISEESIKRILYPYADYCTKHGNIPIIDLGDLAETVRGIGYNNWSNNDKEIIKKAYKFYKSYAKAIAQAPEIENYGLIGNHDEHPFLAGVDPIQIIFDNSKNFTCLGVSSGSFKISNDKIAVYHDKNWQNIISYTEYSKQERDEFIYEYLCEEMKDIAKDYVYSLIGHYHFGKINASDNFAVINNGIDSTLLFTAVIKNGQIEKMYVTELFNNGSKITKSNYDTEIYSKTKTL